MPEDENPAAPAPPASGVDITVRRMPIAEQFNKLTPQQKLYAHHMSKAAWLGARITFEQVSPESSLIFDLIMELYRSCEGNWDLLLIGDGELQDATRQLKCFKDYAATFLVNVGNYYGHGDQKILPSGVTKEFLLAISSSASPTAKEICTKCIDAMFAPLPASLGYPSSVAQSWYYPSEIPITGPELRRIGVVLQENKIGEENTRVRKVKTRKAGEKEGGEQEGGEQEEFEYHVLLASIELDNQPQVLSTADPKVLLIRGDHSSLLSKVSHELTLAKIYAENPLQEKYISEYLSHFLTGSLEMHKESQRTWVKDHKPPVEMMFGFVEPYRDPYGTRAEFEGIVAVVDKDATEELTQLVAESQGFIATLPWVVGRSGEGGRNGPFEKDLPELPDFTAIHGLWHPQQSARRFCQLGLQLMMTCEIPYSTGLLFQHYIPGSKSAKCYDLLRAFWHTAHQYDDVRQTCGFKNVMIRNRNRPFDPTNTPWTPSLDAPYVSPTEAETYLCHWYFASYLHITIHELLGHGTGKLLCEITPGKYNFDIENPPVSPLTGEPVTTWYKLGQTWTGVFGNLATSMEECRAECVGSYLITDIKLLGLFGYTGNSKITAEDIIYNDYINLGVEGLRALENYIVANNKWGQAHSRGHFAQLRTLLSPSAEGFMTLTSNPSTNTLTITIDRTRILSHGKRAIGELLLKLHIYRCTANVDEGRKWYEELTEVDEYWLGIREIVMRQKGKRVLLVQGNTTVVGGEGGGDGGEKTLGTVETREYEESVEGVIRSWAERGV